MEEHHAKVDRDAPMDIGAERFRSAGHVLIDQIADLLADLPDRRVTAGLSESEIRDRIDASACMPDKGCDVDLLLSEATAMFTRYSLYNGHPKFLGYITSSPAPIGMLADLLASAVNANVGAWALSPVATEIEAQTVRWIAELLGFPSTCSGILVSGGNMANYVGIYTALRSVFPRGDVHSPDRIAKATVYASSETHTWIEKAIDLFGFPADALRSIQVDEVGRLVLEDLNRQLSTDTKRGRIPVAVVGTAGSVSTGAIDPLPAMAKLCRQAKVWFHVDGAYGGFAAMLPSAPNELSGLAEADSVAVDPHKWLYAPLEAGCVLIRDPEKHRAAYSYRPLYYHFGEETTNFVDYGPENSRSFRAFKVWMGLKQVGRRGYERMIADDIALARALYDLLAKDPLFEVYTQSLSITTFRFVPASHLNQKGDTARESYLNQLNEVLQERLETSGELFLSNAIIGDRYLLRTCIVNFRTSSKDIDEIPVIIACHGKQVHEELLRTS